MSTKAAGPAKAGSDEWRIQGLEENFLNFKESQRSQESKAAGLERRVDERLKVMDERLALIQERLEAVESRPQAPEVVRTPAETSAETPAQTPAEPAEMGRVVAQSGEEKPWAKVPGPAAGSGPDALYQEGLRLARADQPQAARKALTEFLSSQPKSALVPNALYWIGETFYSEKNFTEAVLAFKEVTRRFPKHEKSAAALLKIGMSHLKAGDRDNAAFYLRALVDEFPASEPAGLARNLLKDLPG
ncbi:MAG: tol-pal system protein YbgF [Desulfovibrionaceae bacterium]|nr:tol-pal system protein YbgF [Desulfovibrionaceae bacterium]